MPAGTAMWRPDLAGDVGPSAAGCRRSCQGRSSLGVGAVCSRVASAAGPCSESCRAQDAGSRAGMKINGMVCGGIEPRAWSGQGCRVARGVGCRAGMPDGDRRAMRTSSVDAGAGAERRLVGSCGAPEEPRRPVALAGRHAWSRPVPRATVAPPPIAPPKRRATWGVRPRSSRRSGRRSQAQGSPARHVSPVRRGARSRQPIWRGAAQRWVA
jgi:hypothetical protein